MRIALTVFLYVSISCQDYNGRICTENASRRTKYECSDISDDTNDYVEENQNCGYTAYVTDKTISCMNTSLNYLKNYRELIDEGPPYPLTLIVTNSEIPLVPTSTFQHLKNVSALSLENIKLKRIMPGAFNFLDRLEEIYLGHNELTTISDGIFNSLTTLRKIDLSRNKIEIVTNHAFVGTALNNLNLNNNNISMLDDILISSLIHVSVLDVSHNNLRNVSDFRDLPLHNLNLSYNSIESVDFENFPNSHVISIDISFNNIIELTNLNVSNSYKIILTHNKLDFIPSDEYIETRILDISHNNIETLGPLNVRLLEFYASFNLISSISSEAFFGLHELTHLDVSNNNLSSIPNSCLKDLNSLIYFNISGNKLTSFKYGTFDNLRNLRVLDISNNNFKELPQYIFHSLNKLSHLYFQNNEISNINIDDLVDHMKNLLDINLSNNTWSCLKLVNIVHKLKSKNIIFLEGDSWEENNIHGIKCYDTFKRINSVNVSNAEINLDDSKLNSFFNEDFTKTILYKYFNQDFKESEFFKYLENLKKSSNVSYTQNTADNTMKKLLNEIKSNPKDMYGDFRKSEMYNYFNKDFRNSSFVKYLENFTQQAININKLEKIATNKLDDISNSFKNLTKEFGNILKVNNSNKAAFEKSNMYNYFNNDFKASSFFKYLENLNVRLMGIHSQNITESRADHLISPVKINEYPKHILYINVTILMLILLVILVTAYRLIFRENKYIFPRKEEVELI